MEWSSYIDSVLNKKNSLCDLKIKGDGNDVIFVPPFIRFNIEFVEKIIEKNQKKIILVLPEKDTSFFLIIILKVIDDIIKGKIKKNYNPKVFERGQKLKCGNCVVEFDRIETDERQRLFVKCSDLTIGIPIELSPYFQMTDTRRRLSTYTEFSRTKSEMNMRRSKMSDIERLITDLIDYKTHLDSAVYYIAPFGKTRDMFNEVEICGKKISELLLFGHPDYCGDIEVINKGQLKGDPAIVVSSELNLICESILNEKNEKYLYIDIANSNVLNNELDVLDDLLKKDINVVCFTNTVNSFSLASLESRGFTVWRWDKENITKNLISTCSSPIEKKIKNCAEQKIDYIESKSSEISYILKNLYLYSKQIEEASLNMTNLYNKLFDLSFLALRNIYYFHEKELEEIGNDIKNYKSILDMEKRYISKDMYEDFNNVLNNLKSIFCNGYDFKKITDLSNYLFSKSYGNICIVVHEKVDKNKCQKFWEEICDQRHINTKINIFLRTEYHEAMFQEFDLIVITSWFGKEFMKQVVFGYDAKEYLILLYEYEERWKNSHLRYWESASKKRNQSDIVELINPEIVFNKKECHEDIWSVNDEFKNDELSEIELILKENKYREYSSNVNSEEQVEVLPIDFVGGYFAFYKTSHKIITITDIISGIKDEICMILPSELKIGDFIVERESQHDLIKELADIILKNSGKSGYRGYATKWKEALLIESIFSNFEDIYRKLRKAGCTKNQYTVRQWMKNEDIISPQDIEDLKYIGIITGDQVLQEKYEDIYNSGKEVKRAHIKAGKVLSEKLKKQIAQKIQEFGVLGTEDLWESMVVELEDIGNVKILKVKDIGTQMLVNSNSANIIISE